MIHLIKTFFETKLRTSNWTKAPEVKSICRRTDLFWWCSKYVYLRTYEYMYMTASQIKKREKREVGWKDTCFELLAPSYGNAN